MENMEIIVRVSFGLRNTVVNDIKRYLENLPLQSVLSKGNLQVIDLRFLLDETGCNGLMC